MPANVSRLGDLERALMNALWDAHEPLTAYQLQDRLAAEVPPRTPSATTVLTVLGRLGKKGFVVAAKDARPHRYRPVSTRAAAMARFMHDVLAGEDDREAVLERFAGEVSDADAAVLRRLLER